MLHSRLLCLLSAFVCLTLSAPLQADPNVSSLRIRFEARQAAEAQRRLLNRLPPPQELAQRRPTAILSRDIEDLARLPDAILRSGSWRPLFSAEDARLARFSGDGRSVVWYDQAKRSLYSLTLGAAGPKSLVLAHRPRALHVPYLAPNQDATEVLFALQDTETPMMRTQHRIWAPGGPSETHALSLPSPQLEDSGACYAPKRVFFAQSLFGAQGPRDRFPGMVALQTAWLEPSFGFELQKLSELVWTSKSSDPVPSRTAGPSYAQLAHTVSWALGVPQPPNPPQLEILTFRPGEVGPRESLANLPARLRFEVPGAPASFSVAASGTCFAYAHGPVRRKDPQSITGLRDEQDSLLAQRNQGFYLLFPGRAPVLIQTPQKSEVFSVDFRPNGVEILVTTDLDQDGEVEGVLYDLDGILVRMREERFLDPKAVEANRAPKNPQAEAKAKSSPSIQAMLLALQTSLKEHEYHQAIETGEDLLQVLPKDRWAKVLLGSAHLALDHETRARRLLHGLDPSNFAPSRRARVQALRFLMAGLDQFAASERTAGLETMAKALDAWESIENPGYPVLIRKLIEEHLYRDAEEVLLRWKDLGARELAVLYSVRLASLTGKHAWAIEKAKLYLVQRQSDPGAHTLLGDAYLEAGQKSKALKSFLKARDLDPTFSQVDEKILELRELGADAGP